MNKKLDTQVIIFLLMISLVIWGLGYWNYKSNKNHIPEWTANSAIRFLSHAQQDLSKNELHECTQNLERAVKIMKSIEHYSDDISNEYIENSIHDLSTVITEINEEHPSLDDLNVALFEALNAVAYADLKIAEVDLEKGDLKKSLVLLKTSLFAVKRSARYMQPQDVILEQKVILDMQSVIDSLEITLHIHPSELENLNKEIEEVLEREYLE